MAIGALVSLGSTVLGALSGGAFVATTAISSAVAGAVGGAIVGAAVGGLSAAIMGGDIGQGILFGAIGGAVTGGIGGYLSGAGSSGFAATVAPGAGKTAIETGMSVTETAAVASKTGKVVATTSGATQQATQTISGSLKSWGGELVKEYGGDMVKGMATTYLSGKKMDAETENAMKLNKQKIEGELAILREKASLSSSYGGSGDAAGLARVAEDRRQFDTQWEAAQQAKAKRKALFKGYANRGLTQAGPGTNDPGAYERLQAQDLSNVQPAQTAQAAPATAQAAPAPATALAPRKPEEAVA